jgi:predicted RNase H-like HicB family nuclease
MNVSELMKRPYHVVLVRDETEDGQVGWAATVAELPGCFSQGDTPAEAAGHIQDAMRMWFEGALEEGYCIPEPAELEYPEFPLKGERIGQPRFAARHLAPTG